MLRFHPACQANSLAQLVGVELLASPVTFDDGGDVDGDDRFVGGEAEVAVEALSATADGFAVVHDTGVNHLVLDGMAFGAQHSQERRNGNCSECETKKHGIRL